MTKSTRLDEKVLSDKAYTAYLYGRLASLLPEHSALWALLTRSYAAATRQPLEPYCFAKGLLAPTDSVLGPQALLDAVHAECFPPRPRRKRRRPRRPDTRWGAKS